MLESAWFDAPVLMGLTAVTLVALAAWRWGGPLERRGALWIWGAWVFTPLGQLLTGVLDPAVLFGLVDAVELGGLVALTWRSGRVWPVAAAALQALAVALDALRLVHPVAIYAYVTALTVVAYGLLACLAAGTWTAAQRRRARG